MVSRSDYDSNLELHYSKPEKKIPKHCTPFRRNNPANTKTDAASITCITRGSPSNLNTSLTQILPSSSFTRIWMKIHGHVHPACQCVCILDSSFAENKQEKKQNKHNTNQLILDNACSNGNKCPTC